jgi:CRISPR system Cascade subunit CasE
MYLSLLLVDTGTNPDRPRPGRRWLQNPYHVHQRLCMAFPSAGRRERDREFLARYDPGEFGEHARVERGADAGFLYRLESVSTGRAMLLVQSAVAPDFGYAFGNVEFLACPPETKQLTLEPHAGQRLRFRLRANPTVKREGKRRAWRQEDEQRAWLARKGQAGGFEVASLEVIPEGFRRGWQPIAPEDRKSDDGRTRELKLFSVLFEGELVVTDPTALLATVEKGVGSGKGLGFGLLSLAPPMRGGGDEP